MTTALNSFPGEIYLSRSDVFDLAHYSFYIAINHGYHHRYVEENYPGWRWEQLYPVIEKQVLLSSHGGEVSPRHLPHGVLGVLVDVDGHVVVDDGSLEHAAKTASWARSRPGRLAEQCAVRGKGQPSLVIVHAPHTSRHIPAAVRSEIVLSDTELAFELAAMTDAGVLAVLESLIDPLPTIAIATMSRLVFDSERFPVGDPMEEVGMGLVYTRRADGSPLRSPLAPERLDWYRAQHLSYTASLERLVEAAIEHFEAAVIIDLHSYPKDPLGYEDATRERPEICIGTDPLHTPDWLAAAAGEAFAPRFTVGINSPFAGAYVPGRFYGTGDPVYSVMVEVRRDVLERPGAAAEVAHQIAQIKHCAGQIIRAGRGLARNEGGEVMSDAPTPHPGTVPASSTVSGVCRVCGERYTFDVPDVRGLGSSMAAGFYRRRAAEGLCPCCHKPGHRVAERLNRLRRRRRRVRRLDSPTLLLALALTSKKPDNDDVFELLAHANARLARLPEVERQALAAEARVLPRTTCCPPHARSEIARAMTVAGVATPGVLSAW